MKRFTDAGRRALKEANIYAALSLALMLPDICGSIEDPGPGKSQKRYERWCKKWIEPKYTPPAFGTEPASVMLTAQDCFQLRCSLIHSGSAEIEANKRKDVDRFEFFDNTLMTHCIYVGGSVVNGIKQPRILQLNASRFSEDIYAAAEAWDSSIAGDVTLQAEKANLLVLRSKGTVISGVKFG